MLNNATLADLRQLKQYMASRGMFPGTSGNVSVRHIEDGATFNPDAFEFAITASGKDKSIDTPEDFLFVDQAGIPTEQTAQKPSAETLIHCEIYRITGAGAIAHTHSVTNNVLSEWFWERGSIPIQGVELIKAFNIWDFEAQIDVPIVENDAHVPSIVPLITARLDPRVPGIMLRKHGIYAWGANTFEAKRHLEAFEFLFEYVYKMELLHHARSSSS